MPHLPKYLFVEELGLLHYPSPAIWLAGHVVNAYTRAPAGKRRKICILFKDLKLFN